MENNVLKNEDKNSYNPAEENVENYLKNNTTMYDNYGKYFDSYLFNAKFNNYIEKESKSRLLEEKIKTNDLDNISNMNIEPYELPINKIIMNIKDLWFTIFDNIIDYSNPFINFDNDKIFYFAISLIAISLIYLFFYVIFY